jgi:hypothetical protein
MAGAQTIINNQLKAATATATAMAMMTTKTTAAAAAWQQCGGGNGGSSAATARMRRTALHAEKPAGCMPTSCCDWTRDRKRQWKAKDKGEETTWSKPESMSLNYGMSGWMDAT